jgi:hypothetical protein
MTTLQELAVDPLGDGGGQPRAQAPGGDRAEEAAVEHREVVVQAQGRRRRSAPGAGPLSETMPYDRYFH